MSERWLPFRYRDFYDVPRLIVLERSGTTYLLECVFEEARDEYSDQYVVQRLDEQTTDLLDSLEDWLALSDCSEVVGNVPVAKVEFDPTKRKMISEAVFDGIQP